MDDFRKKFYSSYAEISRELDERKNDEELKFKILDYLGDDFPIFLNNNLQHGLFVRCIQTPNYEHWHVKDMMEDFNLHTMFCNYTAGKLVMKNSENYHLVKMCFIEGVNSKKELIFSKKNIVNINENEGKRLKDIFVKPNLNLIEFHQSLFEELGHEANFFDIAQWFDNARLSEDGYYAKFLALFIYHGVLFDNFLLADTEEQKFFMEKVWPSFEFIKNKFGVKPLILPILPIKDENNKLSLFYNSEIKNIINNKYDL